MERMLWLFTDERVGAIIRHFENQQDWTILEEIDSLNWGEGYDMKWKNLLIRCFDSERFDWVDSHLRKMKNPTPQDYEEWFERAVEEYKGESKVGFDIRFSNASSQEQQKAIEALRSLLIRSGYSETSIEIEEIDQIQGVPSTETLDNPQSVTEELSASYQEMAQNFKSETEALEWSDTLLNDVSEESA